MGDKAVITCALNGVLTDPKQHNVPVTPEQMAREARAAFNAGAHHACPFAPAGAEQGASAVLGR
jgi:uncharacterized protein (DUF849 family)